jgi:hypothetical protein
MRLYIGTIVLLSLLFLFGGLLAVGVFGNKSVSIKYSPEYNSQSIPEKYSMKQIDSLTSKFNYANLSTKASRSANLP